MFVSQNIAVAMNYNRSWILKNSVLVPIAIAAFVETILIIDEKRTNAQETSKTPIMTHFRGIDT